MSVDTGELEAFRLRVDSYEAELAKTSEKLDEMFSFMRQCVVAAGIDPGATSSEGRRERHLYLVRGGRL